jgi:3-hydroxyisobutyrate dehydrogenase-like beta-hydroxyacid dehydrogenase
MMLSSPRQFPDKAFPPEYVLKDLGYVLELAAQSGLAAHVAELAQKYYAAAVSGGYSGRYFPSVIELIDHGGGPAKAESQTEQADVLPPRSRAHG